MIRNSDCNQVVGDFVDAIKVKQSVNLAILDGFGIECYWSSVKMLASVPRMDLVILFPGNMTVVRNAERWSQEDDAQLIYLCLAGIGDRFGVTSGGVEAARRPIY